MIRPRVGICTCIMEGFNLDEKDSIQYQKSLIDSVKSLDFEPVIMEEFISSAEIAKKAAVFFKEKNVDLYILNQGTFSDDFRVMPLFTGTDAPLIIWAHDYNAFNISITGSQNIIPNLFDLGLEYRFIYGKFDDKIALCELYQYARACAIKNKLKNTNIGYVGGHPKIMTSLTADEIMIKKTFGLTLHNFGNEDIIYGSSKVDAAESKKIWKEIKDAAGKVDASDELGLMTSSIFGYIFKMVSENALDAISINCFPHLKGKVCIPIAKLNDLGVPSACEGDLDSTILMFILYQLSGRAVSNGDQLKVFNLDRPDNSLMFSHCGAGAFSLAGDKKEITIHADYETGEGIAVYFPERIPGEVTMASMHGSRLGYRMFMARGNALDTNMMKHYEGNPINIRFDFNIREMFKRIAAEGFGHHWNICYGNQLNELSELCRMLNIEYSIME
jgi:L-fucose isomerase-like protein